MCSILFTNKDLQGDYNRLLKLRGPDGTNIKSIGNYNFVHNLLSLPGEKRVQPIVDDCIIILLNGEIYNYNKKHKSDGYSIIDFVCVFDLLPASSFLHLLYAGIASLCSQ